MTKLTRDRVTVPIRLYIRNDLMEKLEDLLETRHSDSRVSLSRLVNSALDMATHESLVDYLWQDASQTIKTR